MRYTLDMNLPIIGSVAFDSITTPFGKIENALGGAATYSSLAASYFAEPGIVGVVGDDFSEEDLALFKKRNIDVSGLEKTSGKTFRWGGEYNFDLNSRTTLFTELNVFENFSPKLPDSYKRAEYVFLGNIHPLLQQQVLNQLANPKVVAFDTMNYWIEKTPQELLNIIKLVDIIIINDSEAREFTKAYNIVKAAKKILGLMGSPLPTVIIKRGEYGLLMFQDKKIFHVPGYPLEAVLDPTGAGDTFAGGFMGYIASQKNASWETLQKAAVAGSVLASFCVEKMATQGLIDLTADNINERLKEFKEFTEF